MGRPKKVELQNKQKNELNKLNYELQFIKDEILTLLSKEPPNPVKKSLSNKMKDYIISEKPELYYIQSNPKNNEKKLVFDSNYPSNSLYGSMSNNTIVQDNQFKGYPYLSILSQNGIVSSILDTLANECISSWIKLVSTDDSDNSELILQINNRLNELNLKEVLRRSLRWNFLFGGCMLFIEINNINSGDSLTKPFIPSALTLSNNKKITNIQILEPYYCVPIEINTSNPLANDFYVPSIYSIYGQSVHRSHLLKLSTNEAPIILKPIYNYFGIPMIQQQEEYIERFELINTYIIQIVQRMRTYVLLTNGSNVLTQSNLDPTNPQDQGIIINCAQAFKTRLQAAEKAMNNNGLWALDKDTEDLKELNSNLSGLSDLVSQVLEQMCIIPKIPATKLLGISPRGMNATGESDLNNFYSLIDSYRKNHLSPIIQNIIDLLVIEITGKINNTIISHEWEPVFTKEMEESQIETNRISTIKNLVESGILTQEEARRILSQEDGWDLNESKEDLNNELELEELNNLYNILTNEELKNE